MHLRAYKIYKKRKRKIKIVLEMLKEVCSRLNLSFTFPGPSNQIFELNTFEYSFIQHLVFHHCGEYKTYVVKCVSNIFIDIRMSIICCVPQKIKRREGYKQGQREEAKTTSKKKQDWNTKKKIEPTMRFPCLLTGSKHTYAYGTCIALIIPTVA